jgi:hypothetical protein
VVVLPELIPEYRCALCRIARDEPELVRDLHQLAVHGEPGGQRLDREIGQRLVEAGYRRPERRAYARHVRRHVVAELVPTPGEHDVEVLAPSESEKSVAREWDSLWRLYESLARRVAEVDAQPDAFLTDDGRFDGQRLAMWSSAVDRCRALLSELGKLRNTERLLEAALNETIRSYATGLAAPLGVELRAALQAARRGEHVVDVLMELVEGDRLARVFREAAESTVEDVRERYRLGPG